ncbi:MAG: carboxy-S-adenosyl-L-methionine synthase CmoA [Pseudomonadales bacterium]
MKKDIVYAAPLDEIDKFEFDERVADVFENMINRSVPGYSFILELIGLVTGKYAVPQTNCYDLGCSLGASTLMIRRHLPASCRVFGVDNSVAMVERCRANIARDHSEAGCKIIEARIQEVAIENASIVVMNYTLQFISPAERLDVLKGVASGMVTGGALILSEKIRFEDVARQEAMTELHHEFKRYHGYSDLEISQKRAALEEVLVPESEAQHISRLRSAGFSSTFVLSRNLNFCTFLAIR